MIFPEGLSPIQKMMYLKSTGREPVFKSHVYLGILNWADGRIFLKVGKADNPKKRAQAYCTHIPRGLTRMIAAAVKNKGRAFDAEDRLYEALLAIQGAQPESGEWVSIAPESMPIAESVFAGIGGEVFEVEWTPPSPKKKRRVDLAKDDEIEALYRVQSQQADVVIQHKKRRGVAGPYAGTLRG